MAWWERLVAMVGEKSWGDEGRWGLRKGYEGMRGVRAYLCSPLERNGSLKKMNWKVRIGKAAWSCLCSVLCGFLIVPTVFSAESDFDENALTEVREVVQQLQARYEKTKDLQADFTQKTMIEGFEQPITSSGKVYLKKPGRLRWNYLDPSVEDIHVNHDDVKVYVPEHKQVLVGKLTQMAASKAPLELLLGAAKLNESFNVEPTPGKGRGVGGIRLLTLLPKSHEGEAGSSLQRIVLEVFPKTYFIRTLSLHEFSGNVARFEFSSLQSNLGLSDSVFTLKLPADVEIVKAPVLSAPQ
ncbi:MAG: outer membrane lipoprotein carrier protein LolA [Nitrospira sp.]|nr:MAG: outer membrane lipoprotein carrier protein LolA [Nitrospira sp.]